jgi:Ca2+-binding RTX toxin-like protein
MIAAFFADIDTCGFTSNIYGPGAVATTPGGTSTGSNLVWYDFDANGNGTLTITWDDVGYYRSHTDKLNAYQMRLVGTGGGNFDIEFRYESINWTTGDASDGSEGLGGTIARAGYTAGDGINYYELSQSGDQEQMLNLDNSLGNTGYTGYYHYSVSSGTTEDDLIIANYDNSIIFGGIGNDFIYGMLGNDHLDGGLGDDILYGGDDDDELYGGNGNDLCSGDNGNDLIIGGSGAGDDTYQGGPGEDTVKYTSALASITVDLINGTATSSAGGDAAGIGTDALIGIENIIAGNYADVLIGDVADNRFEGGSGNDTLSGGAGNDTLDGGSDDDTAVFSSEFINYSISFNDETDTYTVVDTTGIDGTDSVIGVEHFQFADNTKYPIDSIDSTLPTVLIFTPTDDIRDVTLDSNITLTFSEAVQRGSGSIEIRRDSVDGPVIESYNVATDIIHLSIEGNKLTIIPTSGLTANTQFFVTLDEGSIKDFAGNKYSGTSSYNFFTIIDTVSPTVTNFIPADTATGIAIDSNIEFTFSEAVQRGTGTIALHNGSFDGPIIESYNAETDTSHLTIDDDKLTINPASDLSPGTHYYVTFGDGSINDFAGNHYDEGPVAYNFTTAAAYAAGSGSSGGGAGVALAGVAGIGLLAWLIF